MQGGLNIAFLAAYYFAFSDLFYHAAPTSKSNYPLLLINANLLYLLINLVRPTSLEKEFRNYALFVISYLAVIIILQGYDLSRLFHLYFCTGTGPHRPAPASNRSLHPTAPSPAIETFDLTLLQPRR